MILQRVGNEHGPEMGAADADIDDMADRFSCSAATRTVAHRFGKGFKTRADGTYVGHDVPAVNRHGAVGQVTERDVQDGAVLGDIDPLTGEHGRPPAFHVAGGGHRRQKRHGLGGNAMLGIINQQRAETARKVFEALGFGDKQGPHRPVDHDTGVIRECGPRRRTAEDGRSRHSGSLFRRGGIFTGATTAPGVGVRPTMTTVNSSGLYSRCATRCTSSRVTALMSALRRSK